MPKKDKLPSEQVAWECSSLSLDNAIKHLDWAEKMATESDWGIGTGHLVLSLEEGAKSAVLAIYGLGCLPLMQSSLDFFISKYRIFKLDPIDLTDLVHSTFRSHPTKHIIAFYLLLLFWMRKEEKRKADSKNNIVFLSRIVSSLFRSLRESKEFGAIIEWLGRADQLKQKGFYVDYKGNNSLTPAFVSERDYAQGLSVTRTLIDKLITIRRSWIEAKIDRDDFIKQLTSQQLNIENEVSAEMNLLFTDDEVKKLINDAEKQIGSGVSVQ